MTRRWSLAGALAACATALALLALPAHADTAISLYGSYKGKLNFAGTQATIRDRASNASACQVSGAGVLQKATLTLPARSTVVSAQLYWAGSGSADTRVTMNDKTVSADANRVWSSTTIGGGMNYFAAAADVTQAVKDKGGGSYSFSGLSVSNGNPWCGRSAVLGGFALVVVYSHDDEIFRTLNLYEGFRAMLNSEVRLDMSNFRVPDNVSSNAIGRFTYLVWEGDSAISQDGESVSIYNYGLTQATYAPSGNNFNSKSSINSDTNSLGIDFDAFSATGFPGGLNAISATFRAGGDLVLLNSAVLAVPSVPEADLTVALARSTELRPGAEAIYTATVSNKGPGAEAGPVKLSFSLPTGVGYAGFSGSNWSCSVSGSTVNCSYNGALASGAKAPVLTLRTNVAAGASGDKTTTATVTGNNDPAPSNNQASEKGTVISASAVSYAFTSRRCDAGEVVGVACPLFLGPVVAGATPSIFITAIDAANKARVQSATQVTTVAMAMALGCVNPAGPGSVKATLASGSTTIQPPACSADKTVADSAVNNSAIWSSATTVSFAANQASSPYTFSYLDAGAVRLYASTTGAAPVRTSTQFVSVPAALKLTVRNADGKLNPGAIGLAGDGFARAGEKFTIGVEALSTGAAVLPSFGKETGADRATLVNSAARLDQNIDKLVDAEDAAEVLGSYPASGAFSGTGFTWSDIGSFRLGVALQEYLDVATSAVGTQDVGRFYPAAFETVATPAFDCLPRMNCPSADSAAAVDGAVYSDQPFNATVIALDEAGVALKNFDSARYPQLVPTLTLQAVTQPFGATAYAKGFTDTPAKTSTRAVRFGLGELFDADAKPGSDGKMPVNGRLAPAAVYLRATAPDKRMGAALTISSAKKVRTEQQEGGVMVVSGRLAIANVIGSERLSTPIPMTAQYWTGRNWENNGGFEHQTLLRNSQATFSGCPATLRAFGSTSCDATLVKSSGAAGLALALDAGRTRYSLAPLGSGRSGSFRIRMNTKTAAPWLPSTYGQISIGLHRSPVIYLRELY